MNKSMVVFMACLVSLLFNTSSFATVTLSNLSPNGSSIGDAQRIPGAVTVTGNDTTGTIPSPIIDNRDGRIESINAAITTTASSGTSPTANLILKGSIDGTNFYTILSGDATPVAVQSGALSTSSATTIGFDSAQELRTGNFPPYLRVDLVQGGTTPGITGVESLFILRRHVQK